jgi:hypothetical protein
MNTYDPNKSYSWGPDTKFVLSGQDFSLMLHAVRGVLSTKEATNTILVYELNKKIEEVMANAVADGRVVETPPQGAPQQSDAIDFEEVKPAPKSRKLAKV